MAKQNPFKYFKTSPEVIRLAVMMYIRFPLSLRNVEDLLHERGIDISYETIRFWWNRFGPIFASDIRRKRVQQLRAWSNHKWHLDEMYVKINGEIHYLWSAVDHEGEVLEALVTKRRDRKADAQKSMGFMYLRGTHIRGAIDGGVDEAEASRWLHLAAEQGHGTAQFYLCLLYTSPSPRDGLLYRM